MALGLYVPLTRGKCLVMADASFGRLPRFVTA
jgi:hypothetical protein